MELTKITKELLAAGWTKDLTPDGFRPWNDFYGGWEYKESVFRKFVFRTPCGMLVKGDKVTSDMSYMGVHWMVENDNPVINCPFWSLRDCPMRHPLLRGEFVYNYKSNLGNFKHCAVCRTDLPWNYENSVEMVLDANQQEEDALWEAFLKKRKGRACKHQCHFNRSEKKWYIHYDPTMCCHYNCSYCAILDKPVSEKKANVYYDLKKSHIQTGQGFMPDETIVSITKGIKLLRASETICEAIVKYSRHEIQSKAYLANHSFCYWGGSVEVMNLRFEKRESRDLLQDLQDVSAGIEVHHQSDIQKAQKAAKSARRKETKRRREERFQKLIRMYGFEGLSTSDQIRARKHLSSLEIAEAEKEYRKSLLPPPKDDQMNLWDADSVGIPNLNTEREAKIHMSEIPISTKDSLRPV